MSQNSSDRRSPSPLNSQRLPKATAPQPGQRRPLSASLDENADRLMDDVFGEIERLLERGAQLQVDVTAPEPSPQPAQQQLPESGRESEGIAPNAADAPALSSSLALLPKLSPRQLTREGNLAEDHAIAKHNDDSSEESDDTDLPLELVQEKPQPAAHQSLEKWLMAIAFVALMISSGLWVFVRYYLPRTAATANVPSAAEILQAKQEAEFLTYVQRSMERIDRASQPAEATAPTATGSPASALPPLYVPLPPPPSLPAAPSLPAVPSPTARISVSPLPPVAAAPTVTAVPSPAAPAPVAAIPNIAPSPTYVLIGLLELGDRSAALLEIDGAPQRIQVGEGIGSSGWSLVSVSGEAAIVRRNGEVRSVYIGQKF